jgi:hypothetical protein
MEMVRSCPPAARRGGRATAPAVVQGASPGRATAPPLIAALIRVSPSFGRGDRTGPHRDNPFTYPRGLSVPST